MKRARVAVLLSLPLSATGMLLAHHVTWRHASHGQDGSVAHGYLEYGAVFAALAVVTLLVAALAQLFGAVRGGGVARAPSARAFAIVPLVGFILLEHLEHLVAMRELEVTFFLSPPFVLGLVLQLPFAFAAMLVVRFVLGFVRAVARAVGALTFASPGLPHVLAPYGADLPLRPALALRRGGRAPPPFR